jgi:membrane-associated phospholipid phosphatase
MLAIVLGAGLSPRRRAILWSAAALVVLIVGASRIYLGAHWLTDVLAGYALGATWVAIVVAVLLITSRSPGKASAVQEQARHRRWDIRTGRRPHSPAPRGAKARFTARGYAAARNAPRPEAGAPP